MVSIPTIAPLAEELPAFRLPMLGQGGEYRAFDVNNDAGIPKSKGMVVVGRYINDWLTLADNTPCIVVTTEGVHFRRVFNSLRVDATLTLLASPEHAAQLLDVEQVLELWEAKAYISGVFPPVACPVSRLRAIALDLQQQFNQIRR